MSCHRAIVSPGATSEKAAKVSLLRQELERRRAKMAKELGKTWGKAVGAPDKHHRNHRKMVILSQEHGDFMGFVGDFDDS